MTTQLPICHIQTLLPQCLPQTSPVVCHIVTQPPQCLPHTSPVICHVTQPPQCLPQTLVGPVCQHVTSPVICHIVTHNNPLCGIQCQAGTHIPVTTTFNTTIVQTQTPVLHGGLAAPAQAQNFAGAAAPAPQYAAQANVGPTGVQHCTAAPQFCGNTAWQPCPPIGPTGVQHCTAAPQVCGNTAWQACPPPQAQMAAHPTTNPTANTHCFVCPPATVDAYQAAPQQAQAMNPTAATHCFVCPPPTLEAQQQVGPTGVQHCTAAPQFCGHTAWHGCQPPLSAPPNCPTVAAAVCHTAATVCTQTVAPTHLLGCTCLPMTVGPVIPTNHMPICGNTCLPMTVGPVIPTHNMPICGHTCLPMTIGPVIPTHNMPICGNVTATGLC
ncbi:hypothetical protein [Undibacterium pigrum]|uniref:Uncharacterized protein n=1 Tax=Undibacterium pigrum TaxID=401470 RepID=A0A318J3Z6_9BURK|nr:hypothetical protein [Undibacterium pigrum]PXX42478.1 hypothetical protein DFR42_105136 [Undibacterium pigrum]